MRKNETWFVDIGNSSIQCIKKINLGKIDPIVLETKRCNRLQLKELFENQTLVVSSVVPNIDNILTDIANCHFVDSYNIKEVIVSIKKPQELGADRLVCALAAYKLFGGPTLIIDSGTALTYCIVNENGEYLGGTIFPGMGIASRALNDFTAKVPYIKVAKCDDILGRTTKEAVEIGLYKGYVHKINGMIDMYRKAYNIKQVVGTGQGVLYLKDELNIDIIDTELIFKGLKFVDDQLNMD